VGGWYEERGRERYRLREMGDFSEATKKVINEYESVQI
jgi:hypothetical protein